MTHKEGIILDNHAPLARGLIVWQSLVQLSIGKRFFSRYDYDLKCEGYVRRENAKSLLKDGWNIGAAKARAIQFNGEREVLRDKRAALLINFKTRTCRIVTDEPTEDQKAKITECKSRMRRVPMIVKSAEDFKAQIYS